MPDDASRSYAEHLYFEAALRAERTVAMLRVAVSLLVGATFFLLAAGPGRMAGLPVLSVGWLVATYVSAYLLLGLLGLWAARPGRFRSWMSWGFATGDVVLCVGAVAFDIWVHDSAANYVSAFPSVWMVPVVLAFGALRYNPRLLIYVGVLAVAGLTGLTLLAGGWVDAMTAAEPSALALRFTGPPNVMRLVMTLVAVGVLSIAVFRSQTVLHRAIDETRRKINLTRYLPQSVAAQVADSGIDELVRSRRQPVAVMFADIRGFTARSETMTPEDLERFLTEFRHRVATAVRAHGGTIDKFMGDGVMAVFGIPQPMDDDARRALACCIDIHRSMVQWSNALKAAGDETLAVGIGIHYGDAFCGAIGDETRLEYTVLGDVVNVASRVEETTKTAGSALLVTAELLAASGTSPQSDPAWRALPQLAVRGRQASVTLFAHVTPE